MTTDSGLGGYNRLGSMGWCNGVVGSECFSVHRDLGMFERIGGFVGGSVCKYSISMDFGVYGVSVDWIAMGISVHWVDKSDKTYFGMIIHC